MIKATAFIVLLLCLCACSTVHIKYGEVEIVSRRLFEDQNLEGLTIKAPDGTTVSIEKKSNNANTELLSNTLGAIVGAIVATPVE